MGRPQNLVFLVIGIMVLLIGILSVLLPGKEISYLNLPQLVPGLISGARVRVLAHYLSPNTLEVDEQGRRIVNRETGEEFTFAELMSRTNCQCRVLFCDSEVAVLDCCGIVFITATDRFIDQILWRNTFESKRAYFIERVRCAYFRREGLLPIACQSPDPEDTDSSGSRSAFTLTAGPR